MHLVLRPTKAEDLDQIMEIEPVAFGSHHWSRQSFINELNNPGGTYFSALDPETGTVCGYSGFWLIADEVHITTLAVHPDFRRQGIGELLLIKDIHLAIKVQAKYMTLEVRVSNDPAQKLYYKYGFKSMGLRRKYYQDNSEDALVLWMDDLHSDEFKAKLNDGIKDWETRHSDLKVDYGAETVVIQS